MTIKTKAHYIRTQRDRWHFYAVLEELRNDRSNHPELDPKFSHIQEQAILSQIADLERDLQEYEAEHGPWPCAEAQT